MKPPITVPSITHVAVTSANAIERRQIAVVHGVCMYQSTGNNSGLANTWFPFLGLNNKKHPHFTEGEIEGYLFKPIRAMAPSHQVKDGYPAEAYDKMKMLFQKTDDIAARFGSLYNMMVSSQFGGGFWDTQEGKTLKNWLKQTYPNFYQHFPELRAEAGPEMSNGLEVNRWMRQQGGKLKKIPLETKPFKAPLTTSDIIGKPNLWSKDYVISWLKFVPERNKKSTHITPSLYSFPSTDLPTIIKPTTKSPDVKEDSQKSVILKQDVSSLKKLADKENITSSHEPTKNKKKHSGP